MLFVWNGCSERACTVPVLNRAGAGVARCLNDATVCDACAVAETKNEVVLVWQVRQCYLAMTVPYSALEYVA